MNRPRAYHQICDHRVLCVDYAPPGDQTDVPTARRAGAGVPAGVDKQGTPRVVFPNIERVTAATAKGKRPAPFRTRKLSPSAPMVLPPREGGRVGHRRTHNYGRSPNTGAPAVFV